MGISKEKVFNIEYTSVLESGIKKRRTSRVISFIKKNKIISITILTFLMCLSLNIVLIYNFMKILENL